MSTNHYDEIYIHLTHEITHEPRRVSDVIDAVLAEVRVDKSQIVSAMWDLIEDESLVYTAMAEIYRP